MINDGVDDRFIEREQYRKLYGGQLQQCNSEKLRIKYFVFNSD